MSHAPLTTLEPDGSWIVILEYAHAIRQEKVHWNNFVIQYIQVVS